MNATTASATWRRPVGVSSGRRIGHGAIVAEVPARRASGARRHGHGHPRGCPFMSVDQARVVVIGGGITGCSVAYHLALAGWTDVLLVEKAQLTAGSTCQAAGLVTAFNPSSTMMRFRRYSIELYRRLGAFETVGSLRLASSPEQLRELERTASRARGIGLDAERHRRRRRPAGSCRRSRRSRCTARSTSPATGTSIRTAPRTPSPTPPARSASGSGPGTRVTGFELSARREITRVLTDAGPIDTELVVDAAGIWAPQVAAMVGALDPVDAGRPPAHRAQGRPGSELPRDMPCFRDPDNLVYGKSEHGGMVFGGYELDPSSRWEDGVPWEHAARSLPPDYERFAPLMAGAIRRFPFLADAEAIRLVCHPDAMTPDANPLLGPLPGRPRLLGRGRSVAQRVRRWRRDRPGDGRLDHERRSGRGHRAVPGVAVRRRVPRPDVRGRAWRARRTPTTTACATRSTRTWPAVRGGSRRSTAASRRRARSSGPRPAGSGPTCTTRDGPWRRAGRDQAAYGWTRPPWLDRVVAEVARRPRTGRASST